MVAIGLEEHGYVPADTWTWFAIVVAGVVAVAVVAVFVGPATRVTVSALLVGLGLGVFAYRLGYGVVRPIPERRLERVRNRGV